MLNVLRIGMLVAGIIGAIVSSVRIFKKTPEETLQFLIQQSDNTPQGELPMINLKVYVDTKHRLDADPTLLLGSDSFAGQAEIKRARWREGFRQAESISGTLLKIK